MSINTNNRPQIIAQLISTIMHPLIVAPVAFVILLRHCGNLNPSQSLLFFGLILVAIVIVPLLSVVRLKRRGKTASLDVPERANRINPFLISVLGYLGIWIALKLTGAPAEISAMMLIYTVNTAIATVITHFWKVSVHGMALGGPIAALGFLVSPQFYWFLLAAPLMIYSRVKLKAHTVAQVVVGFLLGLLLTTIQLAAIL